jgi:hypothetical protein
VVIDVAARQPVIIRENTIDPNRSYWRNQQKHPGRWPGRNQ